MANPFDLVTVDPMQAGQDWRQTLARTAQMEGMAEQTQLVNQETRAKMAADQQAQQQKQQYLQKLQTLSVQQKRQQDAQTLQSTQVVDQGPAFMSDLSARMNIALESGQIKDAESIQKMMYDATQKQAQATEHLAKARAETFATNEKKLQMGEQLLSGVQDQASYDQALEQYKTQAGEDQWYQHMKQFPYSPGIVSNAKSFLIKQRDVAAQQRDLEAAKASARNAASLDALRKAETEKYKYELDYAKKHDTAINKVAGDTGKGKVGSVEALNNQQLIRAGNDIYTGLDEILKLPLGANMGTFADVAYSHDPSFTGAIKKVAANKMTSDESAKYATRLAGVSIAAATIASGGRAARMSQVEAEKQAIQALEGQSKLVAIDKINQAALKAIRGIELMRPASDAQREQHEQVLNRLREVHETTSTALDNMRSSKISKSQSDISQDAYSKLKPGDTFWYGGEQHTKE